MKINVIMLDDKELENKYQDYKNQVNKLIDETNDELDAIDSIKRLKEQAIEFDYLLKERYVKSIVEFTEKYYAENISDVTVENLLMNGLYKKKEIAKILKDNKAFLSDEIYDFFTNMIQKINKDEKILCWNL